MATISASTITTIIASNLVRRSTLSSSRVFGLPQLGMKGGRVSCSSFSSQKTTPAVAGASLLAAAVSMMSVSGPALALVDERMSTEGTGLSLGLSNNLLGWILLGVFGLIWSLFFVYATGLEEDEESGLSL